MANVRVGVASGGSYTKALASQCSNLSFSHIPPLVLERTKYLILDGIGCGIFGSGKAWSKLLTDAVVEMGGGGKCAAWGTGKYVTADQAALLNGAYVQGFELDDYSREGALHACAVTIPPVLSACTIADHPTGADFLTAVIAGFEVGNRLGKCVGSSLILERGWHSGSVVGAPAAAAAAGRLLCLDSRQMEQAFGIAATQAGGLMSAQFGSMVKRMNHGKAAQSGFYAASLASRGYTGIDDVFELSYGGFCTTFTATRDQFNLGALTDAWGEPFEIMNTCVKPYSCNASIHVAIDAIKMIRARREFTADEIRAIVVRCTKSTLEHVGWTYRGSGSATEAQMNLSYCIAVTVIEGDAFIQQFRDELLTRPDIVQFTTKVAVNHEPQFDQLGNSHRHHITLEVEFTDGTRDLAELDFSRGSLGDPLSNSAVEEKYDRLMATCISQQRSLALKEMVLNLEAMQKLDDLQIALCAPGD